MPSVPVNAYQIITDRITALLEQGVVAWQRPWSKDVGAPRNLFSQRPYSGVNVWMLGAMGYESPFWGTFNQVKQAGGNIKKGEKASYVVFWKRYEGTDKETGETENRFTLKWYTVFNAQQLEGVAIPALPELTHEFTPIEQCEQLVHDMPQRPAILHEGDQACYVPKRDIVRMPAQERFVTPERYYSTLFHELTHSTGHEDRLNRPTLTDMVPFGHVSYAKEELVAEMGAAYLCAVCGIENATVDNSAAYIQGWLKRLRNEPKLLVQAAAQAQRAADFIQDLSRQEAAVAA